MAPAQQLAEAGHSQQIERRGIKRLKGRDGGWIQQLA
jgi:hypothetical protein